MEQM
jgi:hypothetical protein